METIFDHNPTDKELLGLFDTLEDAEEYKNSVGTILTNTDGAYAKIVGLMDIRGDVVLVEKYLNKISDPRYKADLELLLAGCLH